MGKRLHNYQFIQKELVDFLKFKGIDEALTNDKGEPNKSNLIGLYEVGKHRQYPSHILKQLPPIIRRIATHLEELAQRYEAAFEFFEIYKTQGADAAWEAYKAKYQK